MAQLFFFSISTQTEGLREVFITFSTNVSFLSKLELKLTFGCGFTVNVNTQKRECIYQCVYSVSQIICAVELLHC